MAEARLLLCNHQSPAEFIGGAESILLEIARSLNSDTYGILILANETGAFNHKAISSGLAIRTIPHDMFWDFLAPGRDISARFQRLISLKKGRLKP